MNFTADFRQVTVDLSSFLIDIRNQRIKIYGNRYYFLYCVLVIRKYRGIQKIQGGILRRHPINASKITKKKHFCEFKKKIKSAL